MTVEEAEQLLGPELVTQLRADAQSAPPLSPDQIRLLVALLVDPANDETPRAA